jgi:outer membrane receptor protein involved in Fe transport
MIDRKSLLLFASVWALAVGAAAQAQTAGQQGGGDVLSEIIVTAEKRAEPIDKVGMSITAVTDEALEQENISTPSDLVRVVPGLTYADAPRGSPVFAIRGVGFNDSTLGSTSPVALYIDEVPISFVQEARMPTLDLERIEVLEGPQGILFGENATAGAINFIAAKPTDTFKAGVDGSFGRFNTLDASGFVSGPLTDTLKVRVSAMGVDSSGWQESYTRDAALGAKRQYAGRLLADWNPNSDLKVSFNFNGWIDKSDTQAAQLQAVNPESPISEKANPGFTYDSFPTAPQNAQAADWMPNSPFPLRRDDGYFQASMRLDYNLAQGLKLTSITDFERYHQDFGMDLDGADIEDFIFLDRGHIDSGNQEIRVAGDFNPVRFILGGNYSQSKTLEVNQYEYDQSSAFYDLSGKNFFGYEGPSGAGAGNFDNQNIKSTAVFGNIDYSVTDRVTLSGGGRYTQDMRSYNGCTDDAGSGTVSGLYNILYPLLFPGQTFDIQPGACTSATITKVDGKSIATPGLSVFNLDQHNVSWRGALNFQVDPNTLLYVNVSRAWKAGAFQADNVISSTELAPVKQETVLVYEAGIKQSLLDHRVQFTAAAYYNDYTDQQVRGRIEDPFHVVGILDVLDNIPKSRIIGGEANLQVIPIRGLILNLSGTYTDSKVTSNFFGYDPVGNYFNYKGLSLPDTPRWDLKAAANYTVPVSSKLAMFSGADITYHSETMSLFADKGLLAVTPLDPANKPGVDVPANIFDERAYAVVDAQLGIGDSDGRWRAWLWGKNIFNIYYWTTATQSFDSLYRLAAMPATYGVAGSYRF